MRAIMMIDAAASHSETCPPNYNISARRALARIGGRSPAPGRAEGGSGCGVRSHTTCRRARLVGLFRRAVVLPSIPFCILSMVVGCVCVCVRRGCLFLHFLHYLACLFLY